MSTDPTTTSQVLAHRFVQHLRATAVGMILALLMLMAFFVAGKIQSDVSTAFSELSGVNQHR